jgi:FkbM family methyltransferase
VNHEQEQWRTALDRATRLAAGPKLGRLLYRPLRYLGAVAFRYVWYPLSGKSLLRRCRTFFDLEMSVALPAGMDLYLLGCKTHDSEIRLTRFFLNHIQPGDIVADVGAHFGFFSLLAARLTGAEGKVFALEPAPQNFRVLRQNTAPFANIHVEQVVIGHSEGTAAFWEFPPLYSEYNTMNPEAVPAHLKGQKIELPCISLDTFAARHGIRPKLVKIDVEGAEWQVVQGMKGLLQSETPPVIAMEYLAGARSSAGHHQAAEWMLAQGFAAHVPDHEGRLRPCADLEAYMAAADLDSENFIFVK